MSELLKSGRTENQYDPFNIWPKIIDPNSYFSPKDRITTVNFRLTRVVKGTSTHFYLESFKYKFKCQQLFNKYCR